MNPHKEIHHYNFPVWLQIHNKNGNPALEIRKLTTDVDVIKIIIECAIMEKPIIVFPTFRDKFRALGTLCSKGILEFNSDKQTYEFKI